MDLASIEAKIAHLERQQRASDTLADHFPLGTGRSRNHSWNAQRAEKHIEKTIDHATALTKLYRQRDALMRKQQLSQEGGEKPSHLDHRQAIETQLQTAQPGDKIVTYLGNTITIAKVNRKSIISPMGSRYTVREIAQIIRTTGA